MKKRFFSLLAAFALCLTLIPTTAFADDEKRGEDVSPCSCETTCTADNMNTECPVCGAENAIPQNCGQYIPVEDRTGENGSTERADDPNGPIELSAADQVQAMINGLPNAEEITEDNAEEVKAQLEAIDEAKEKLSDEEIDELDMTRYAEAAAALGALAAPMLLANDSPDEQFSLTPGGTYYFDLSGASIPGTANSGNSNGAASLPDTSLHYVPFTYAGTIEAYKLTSAMATTEEYAQQNKYSHSLFVADYAVTHKVNWNNLDTASLIFGKNYASGGVDYTLRAPSCGSGFTGSDDSERGTPQSNEWDAVLDKNSGYVKNWNDIYSWGQDTSSYESSFRAVRGYNSARNGDIDNATGSGPNLGFRPVLEVLNPDELGSDGLKAVTLDLGGGKLGGSSDAIHIIVKTGSEFTAPASDGMTRPDENTDSYFMWLGSNGKLYAPGDSVPADVTKLTAQFALSEQFFLTPGGRYYFDLSAMNIPGTANGGNSDGAVSLPDTSLHYVPFTYVGTIEAYKLTSATATTEEYAQQNKYPHSLFVADYAVTHTVSWDDLNTKSLIFGKNYASGGVDYTLRAPSVGSNSTGSGESQHDTPSNNEWDRILDKNSGYIQNWNKMYSWGQDTSSAAESFRAYRGYNSARSWYYTSSSFRNVYLGFRPVLEVLNPDTLGSDGMKAVTLDLNGGKLGGSSDAIHIIVKNGSAFTAPASDGLTRPDGNTGSYFMWLDGNGKSYEPGDSVPADVTELTVQWTAPTYTVTLHANGGTINNGNVTEYTYGVGATLPTDVTRTGYTFKGWYYNENLTGSSVTAIGGTEMGNKEYWAKWEINQYTITVKPENGKADITITQDYGTPITAPTLTREGYQFNGWDKTFPTTMPAGDMTITAQWTLNRYTISYNLNNGTATGNPDSYTVESDAITLNTPTRPGYTFTGWSGTGLDGENNMTVTIPTGSTGERSYTAHWRYNGGGSGGSSSYPITIPGKTENGSVTVSPKSASAGSTVTITVKPDSGYVLETITATDKNGNDLKLTDKGNGKYTFTMPTSKVEIKATFMEDNSVLNFFYDVPNDAYYYEAVKWAAENGITGGVGNSLFAPNQPCTRAQIVTFLWRAAGSPVVNYLMPFTDVDEGAYYAEAVRWAASTGIVTGLTETTFGTDSVCTRAQAAAMIYRCAQAQGKGFTGAWMFHLPFTDVPEWAYESVAWCYMNSVTTGVSETSFAPGNDCTRAQIVTFLWRAFGK